jgi:hypothetical protein
MPFPTIYLDIQIFKIFRLGAKTMVESRGSRAPKVYQASYNWVTGLWYLYIKIPCKCLTEDSVYLQHNVILYIQNSVSENARIAVLGVEKYKNFLRENIPIPSTIRYDTTPNFLLPITIWHLSTLSIVWFLFVDASTPPPPPPPPPRTNS